MKPKSAHPLDTDKPNPKDSQTFIKMQPSDAPKPQQLCDPFSPSTLQDFRRRLDIINNKNNRTCSPQPYDTEAKTHFRDYYTKSTKSTSSESSSASKSPILYTEDSDSMADDGGEKQYSNVFNTSSNSDVQFTERDFRMKIHDITEDALREFEEEVRRVRCEDRVKLGKGFGEEERILREVEVVGMGRERDIAGLQSLNLNLVLVALGVAAWILGWGIGASGASGWRVVK